MLGLIILTGCTKSIDITIPYEEQKLVAFCRFSTDGDWKIHVSQTKPIQDRSFQWIDNARVIIYENNEYILSLPYKSEGWYELAGHKASNGSFYTLQVEAPGFESIRATDTVFAKPNLMAAFIDTANVVSNQKDFYQEEGYPGVIMFGDSLGVKNFYELNIEYDQILTSDITFRGVPYLKGDTLRDNVRFDIEDDVIKENELWYSETYEGKVTFSDLLLDGEIYQLFFIVDSRCVYDGQRIIITFSSISEAVYRIERIYAIQHHMGPFDEPMQSESNLENGYGLFGAYNPVIVTIPLQ